MHVPQIWSRKIVECAVPRKIIVKDRIDTQRKRIFGHALPEIVKFICGSVRIMRFLFHHYHLEDSLPDRRGISQTFDLY